MIRESTLEVLGDFPCFPQEVVRLEQSQARTPIAEAVGAGPAHRAFIEALPAEWQADAAVEIFSRLLYLKEGWYPLGPHYHFDWGGQTAIDGKRVETLMVLLGGGSQTEFILGPLEHLEPEAEQKGGLPLRTPALQSSMRRMGARPSWDEQVEAGLRACALRRWHLEPQKLVLFDNWTLHRACPASTAGWRVLIRAIRGLANREVVDHGPAASFAGAAPRRGGGVYGNLGRFTTCRNGFIPVTDEERARYEPYRDGGRT
ncbi:hypothetical protein [Lacipirellula sp.]|uniref:hypothetical protein n=1 Tax=Lacipirellula sp. TaxID=2691419 RepID=UPI003D129BEB